MTTFPQLNGISSFDPSVDPLNAQLINPILTNLAKQFKPDGFGYDRIVSSMPVVARAGQYPVFDSSYFFALEDDSPIADDAPTPEINFKISTDQYNALPHRRMIRLTRDELLQARSTGDAAKLQWSKTSLLMTRMALLRERRLAAKLRGADKGGQFTLNAVTPSIKWDASPTDQGSGMNATIKNDLDTASQAVYRQCGKRPNTVILTREIAMAIASDFTVRETIKYLYGDRYVAQGTDALPSTLYGYNIIEIDGVLGNTAAEGNTASLGELWGNSARLIYCDANPVWGQPATVYAFRAPVTGSVGSVQPSPSLLPDASGAEPPGLGSWAVVEQWAEWDPPSGLIRAWECVDEKVVAPELGYELSAVITDTNNPS